ncbi:thioredoxin family protein [Paraflavisolibacter sp. H34]|uniref:thioredoxin family protein n=1 Tax=Huijunlia imazamoxiresistens TaxID=3127457 RepID=UPI003015C97F
MDYKQFLQLFEDIFNSPAPSAPYDKPDYLQYTRLNHSRMKRWTKTLEPDPALLQALQRAGEKQHWIILVEPWCGDVAHTLPFLVKLAEQSPFVTYELQLRDSEPYLINSYLTNGGKSIPKLIARAEDGSDLFTWGPRPEAAQALMDRLKQEGADFETIKTELQNWYNADKGRSLQNELRQAVDSIRQQLQVA